MYRQKKKFKQNNWTRNAVQMQEATPESLRIEIDAIFKQFLDNPECLEYIFPTNLNNIQRRYIHEKARQQNLISKSYGSEPNRKLHIRKRDQEVGNKSCHLNPCRESVIALCDYVKEAARLEPNQMKVKKNKTEWVFGSLICSPPKCVNNYHLSADFAKFKTDLPIYPMRGQIIDMIRKNRIVIISSETGSGKTTQIPQYILEDMCAKKEPCKIICTQPRRISTVAVAQRVSEERNEELGSTVGYHIRLEQKYGINSNLIYCTNGVMLRTMMSKTAVLSNITHIIIDEVHERDRLSDFLLICLKRALQGFPKLKIILMSATVNIDKFCSYFPNPKVLSIPGRLYPIEELFLDEILTQLNYVTPAMKLASNKTSFHAPPQIEPSPQKQQLVNVAMDNALMEYWKCKTDFVQAATQISLYMISDNISVNYQHSVKGLTALMIGASLGDFETCCALLHQGANLFLTCKKGKTALDYALERNHQQIVTLINYYQQEKMVSQPMAPNNLVELYDKTVSDYVIDFDLILNVIKSIHLSGEEGAILVFLPGYDDIMICNEYIESSDIPKQSYRVFYLHGSMNIKEQHQAFMRMPNKRKIILSTNIAETSVTIDDVVFVIDSGKAKEKCYDFYNKLSSLDTLWISKACVKQRAGRAGRTRPGRCYHIFSRQRYQNMDNERTPEMLRVSLEELCLSAKILAPTDMQIHSFFEQAPDPPMYNSVMAAIQSLQALGALNENQDLTDLGHYLSQLTVDPRLGKMLLISVIFSCLEPVLTLVATLAQKDPFQLPAQANLKSLAGEKRKALCDGVPSDHYVYLNLFNKWQQELSAGRVQEFCKEYFVSKTAMDGILDTRRHLLGQLRATGFVNQGNSLEAYNKFANSWPMVKAAITSGLYPRIACYDGTNFSTRYEKKVNIGLSGAVTKPKQSIWYAYDEIVKNRNNFCLRGVTAVSPITVGLICGNQCEMVSRTAFIVDNWLEFDTSHQNLVTFRNAIQYLLKLKLSYPQHENGEYENKVLNTLNQVLVLEDNSSNLPQGDNIGVRPKFLYKPMENKHKQDNDHFQGYRSNPGKFPRYSHFNGRNQINAVTNQFENNLAVNGNGNTNNFKIHNDRFPVVSDKCIFMLVKPKEYKSVQIAFTTGKWVFAPQTEKKILHYSKMNKKIYLIFTVLNSRNVQGIALYKDMVHYSKNTGILDWLFKSNIDYQCVKHLRNPMNNDKPLFDGYDGQLVASGVGDELLRICNELAVSSPSN